MRTLPLISLVVPCYEEADNLRPFVAACESALPKGYAYEIIFVDDGSSEATISILRQLKARRRDIKIKVIELSRNFGKEVAVTAGLQAATGEAALMIDCDLQHPPSEIPRFIDRWQQGADIVIGVRTYNKTYAPFLKRWGSKLFYRLINMISKIEITPHATDFRMIDRIVIDEFKRFSEHNRMNRGLIDWLGFERSYVSFVPAQRLNGVAAYNFRKLMSLALTSFMAMSFVPLKIAGYFGLFISLVSGFGGLAIIIEMFMLDDPLGWRISNSIDLAVLIVFLIGIVLMALGMIASYIATIHTEVTNRPLYVVKQSARPRPKPGKPAAR